MRFDQIRHAHKESRALFNGHPWPGAFVERATRGGDRKVHIGRGRFGDSTEYVLGDRRNYIERTGARRLDPLSTDEETVSVHHDSGSDLFEVSVRQSSRGGRARPV